MKITDVFINQLIYELTDLLLQNNCEYFGNAECVEGTAMANRS
jgi:hypothetical protein